jgi:hypothetical protein
LEIKNYKPHPAIKLPGQKRAAICINSEEGRTAARFISAVKDNPDTAWAFVSKVYSGSMDLHALGELFGGADMSGMVSKAGAAVSRRFLTRSLYLHNAHLDIRRLIHFHMIREPDKYGTWKICAVDLEDFPT